MFLSHIGVSLPLYSSFPISLKIISKIKILKKEIDPNLAAAIIIIIIIIIIILIFCCIY